MEHENRSENGSGWADRHYSAKFPNLKPKGSRPVTSSKSNAVRKVKGRVEAVRSKAAYGQYSTEELYGRVLELKNSLNEVREENLRLKTKVHQLEKENRREDNEVDKGSLVGTLKNQLKDSSRALEMKDKELQDLRRSTRATHLTEIEVEIKVYKDECTRLRRILEEALVQLTQGVASVDLQERFLQLSVQFKALRREHVELSMICDELKNTKHSKKKEDIFEALKRSLLDSKEETAKLLEENKRLVGLLHQGGCPNCGLGVEDDQTVVRDPRSLFVEIWKNMEFRQLDTKQLWKILAQDQSKVGAQGIIDGLQMLDVYLNLIEASAALETLAPGQDNITEDAFIYGMQAHRPNELISYSEAELSLRHLSMRLQIRRWTKDQVPLLFVNQELKLTKKTVAEVLNNEPLELEQDDVITVVEFLFADDLTLPNEVFLHRLMLALEDWAALTEEDERRLDEGLRTLLMSISANFIENCEQLDSRRTGWISMQAFMELCKGCEVSEELLHYLGLICYTDQNQLDILPYASLARAYIQEESNRPSSG
jgi:hypothetical protein